MDIKISFICAIFTPSIISFTIMEGFSAYVVTNQFSNPTSILVSSGGPFGNYIDVGDEATDSIYRINRQTNEVEIFATGITFPVAMEIAMDPNFGTYICSKL